MNLTIAKRALGLLSIVKPILVPHSDTRFDPHTVGHERGN